MVKRITLMGSIEGLSIITDQQIFKDACLIPCMLNTNYGFDVTIASYGINEELLHKYFKNVKFVSIKKTGNYIQDALNFLLNNSKDIDILCFFGPYRSCNYMADMYKRVNPNGKIYLKLDMNRLWLSKLMNSDSFRNILQVSDLITVEDRTLQTIINEKYNCEVEYLRNGYYDFGLDHNVDFDSKKNIILTVGRIGIFEKATDVLIDAFLEADLPGWELRLAGEVNEAFYEKIEQYKKNPKFINSVKFLGLINDKELLNNEYKQAKIFCMTSIEEACAHVYPEAAINGCYIISTDVDGISDMKQYSTIVNVGDVKALKEAFENARRNDELIKKNSIKLQEYTKNECSWDVLIGRLYLLFCVKGLI